MIERNIDRRLLLGLCARQNEFRALHEPSGFIGLITQKVTGINTCLIALRVAPIFGRAITFERFH